MKKFKETKVGKFIEDNKLEIAVSCYTALIAGITGYLAYNAGHAIGHSVGHKAGVKDGQNNILNLQALCAEKDSYFRVENTATGEVLSCSPVLFTPDEVKAKPTVMTFTAGDSLKTMEDILKLDLKAGCASDVPGMDPKNTIHHIDIWTLSPHV